MPYKAQASSINLQNIITLTNQEREKQGLNGLTINNILTSAAQAKAQDMISRGYFEHTGPDGKQPWDWIKNAGYNYTYAGENLAIDFENAEDVVKAWMASSSHRDNIIDSNYTDIGIGIAQGEYKERQSIIIVQMFGAPLGLSAGSGEDSVKKAIDNNENRESLIMFLRQKSKLFVNIFKNTLFNKFSQKKGNDIFFSKKEEGNSLFTLQTIFTGILNFAF